MCAVRQVVDVGVLAGGRVPGARAENMYGRSGSWPGGPAGVAAGTIAVVIAAKVGGASRAVGSMMRRARDASWAMSGSGWGGVGTRVVLAVEGWMGRVAWLAGWVTGRMKAGPDLECWDDVGRVQGVDVSSRRQCSSGSKSGDGQRVVPWWIGGDHSDLLLQLLGAVGGRRRDGSRESGPAAPGP